MPPRLSRPTAGTTAQPTRTNKRKVQKSQKRALNAFTAAQHEVSDSVRVRKHRLGQTEPERGPKRRRVDADGEDDGEDEEEDEGHDSKRRDRGEDEDVGSDSSGNEWRMGGPIGEDSDSSLDSDEAFGESDEERFEGFTFRGSSTNKKDQGRKKKTKRNGVMDLNEESEGEEEEDDFGEEGVDLATMLDNPPSDEEEDSGDEGDTEEDDSQSETSVSDIDDDDDDDEGAKISKLQDLVASLENADKQRATTGDITDAHETQQPSDYGVTAAQKLKIVDLLPTVTDPALRKSLKVLAADKPSKRAGIPGKLSAPLPKRQQDQLDRAAATAKAKEELSKWQDTVIQNRRAEHLHFPLMDPNAVEPQGKHVLTSLTQDKPQNELETAIQSILEESGLSGGKKGEDDARIAAAEELQMKEVPLEEVMARRAALRKARELLFREEIKAKRIKKIKSKSYRRVHRRERERLAEKERALMGEDELEDDKERQDRRRAEERMGAKHRESKWAKGMKKSGRTVWDESARDGVVDMARRNEELRRRIEGKDVREDDDSDISDDDQEDESDFDDDSDTQRARVSRQLDKLDQEDEKPQKGIGAMAFMRRAEAAKKAQNEEMIAEMQRDMAREDSDSEDGQDQDADTTLGRRVFGPKSMIAVPPPKPKQKRDALEESEDSAAESSEEEAEIIVDRDSTDKKSLKTNGGKGASKRPLLSKPNGKAPTEDDDGGDWLNNSKAAIQDDDDGDDWMNTKSKKSRNHKVTSKVDFIPNKPLVAGSAPATNGTASSKSKKTASASKEPNTSDWALVELPQDSDNDHDAASDTAPNGNLETQDALHARAFAGDDVDLSFATDKAAQISDEDSKEISNHLPGWGSWTGTGLSKANRARNARQKHNPLFKTRVDGVRAADRRDAKLENVIISEAKDRKGKKYLAGQLPHGFERKEQYERSLRVPLGPEWTTKESFQRNTKPRVVVGRGNIEAIRRPLV